MGVNGLFATLFVLAVKGDLNGPTICGIFTIVGFSSTGKHLRNIAPIMFGVYLASFTKTWAIAPVIHCKMQKQLQIKDVAPRPPEPS